MILGSVHYVRNHVSNVSAEVPVERTSRTHSGDLHTTVSRKVLRHSNARGNISPIASFGPIKSLVVSETRSDCQFLPPTCGPTKVHVCGEANESSAKFGPDEKCLQA